MASSPKPAPKPTSRWGFLSQAVASVESRLDTILADDEVPVRKPTPQPILPKENVPAPRASTESARSSTPANDRLQERLARAMAKKNQSKTDSPAVSEPVTRSSTPGITSPEAVILDENKDEEKLSQQGVQSDVVSLPPNEQNSIQDNIRLSKDQASSVDIPRGSTNSVRPSRDIPRSSLDRTKTSASTEDVDASLLRAQLEHEDVKIQMQEEINGYIERIDALNAKLQYLTKEAAGNARNSAAEAEPGSLEKKLIEKDEKIALLMEEGQKLSMTEMKHLTTIKKLRVQTQTNQKDQDSIRQRAERAERLLSTLEDKSKRNEAMSRNTEAKLAEATKKTQDYEALKREKAALNETLVEMRAQVTRANARAENAESKAKTEQYETEKKRVTELQDDLSSARVERELLEQKLRQEIKDLKVELEKEKAQSRAMESEMLAEQASLEGKLESFRVRAEEASANDQGGGQAKLLRQIETLQSQYAAASQNWQGIEGTFVARISTLEKERDDLSARESDVRRKLKDATSKAKSSGKELEDVQLQYATLQESQSEAQMEMQRLTRRVQQMDEDLARAQKEIEDNKTKMERDFARRLDEEKSRWAASVQLARTESPTASIRKTSTHDSNHLGNPHIERPASRRSSTLASALNNADLYPTSRHHSTTSSRSINNVSVPETPILVTTDPDEYFAGIPGTPVSNEHTPSRRGVGDLISTSTVGAGPSVQLVERMSANVRRLESEKAASKDELARITSQRDESRQEVVRLMREVEQTRKNDRRLKELEDQHKVLNERYQTTLELLGEKSEQVEELKADILDVKQMYRQLADHMK